jgi:Protein of unknown function (DUF1353)
MVTDKKSFMKAALGPHKDVLSAPAAIVPFADWDYYYIRDTIEWHAKAGVAMTPAHVIVPIGFVTDLASIPAALWGMLPPAARYSYPAIIHDYLYWFQPCTRAEADAVFQSVMGDLLVPSAKITIIYDAVRLGGGSAWDSNTQARARGENRILKKFPTDVLITWDQWKVRVDVY